MECRMVFELLNLSKKRLERPSRIRKQLHRLTGLCKVEIKETLYTLKKTA